MSNPFSVPPAPGAPSTPSPFPASPSAAPQRWAAPQPPYPYPPIGQGDDRRSRTLGIVAVVLSSVALLGVLALAGLAFLGPASPGTYALSGKVSPVDKGVQAPDLESAIRSALTDDGGAVGELSCPPRAEVGQGKVVVCHGSVDGYEDWTGIVFFEDDAGAFVLTEF